MRLSIGWTLFVACVGAVAHAAPGWVSVPGAASAPDARFDHAMAYDAARSRIVLFGGYPTAANQGGMERGDTWEYDGAAWSLALPPAPRPSPRFGHVIVYDLLRRRVVLHGGQDSSGFRWNDTWEFDGASWGRGASAPAAVARAYAGFAYDAVRGRAVMFGGVSAVGTLLNDTWYYDGASWSPGPPPAAGLSARWGHAMTFDGARGRTVLFGGRDASNRNDTWFLDGTSWLAGTSAPPALVPRRAPAMAYDAARQRVVLMGGATSSSRLNDIWEHDGTAWLPGPAAPPGLGVRNGHSMAYDASTGLMVVFGGTDGESVRRDTWQYDGAGWRGPVALGLSGRFYPAAAYDASRERFVLVGGHDGTRTDEVWEFDGLAWMPGPAAPPAFEPRCCHSASYDSSRRKVVVFGGSGATSFLSDTWEYDGAGLNQGPPAPPALDPRWGHATAYDEARGCVVLFGGSGNVTRYQDTWEYDGTGWSAAPIGPALRHRHALAYDAARQRIVMFGGWSAPPSTWEYDGTSWTQSSASGPGRHDGAAMAYDPRRAKVVMFGGWAGGSQMLDDTWEYDGTWLAGPPAVAGLLPRWCHVMTYVDVLGGVLMAHGGDDLGRPIGDAWKYTCLDLSPGALPGGEAGVPYSQAIAAAGGTPPYVFALTIGSLPEGLSLAPDGTITGTPVRPGGATFLVRASDAQGCAGSLAYTLAIGPAMDFVFGAGLGPPNPNRVRVFTGAGTPAPVDFFAYGAGAWGVNVSTGNIDGTAHDEMLTGPGPGRTLGPVVRAFRRDGTAVAKVSFYAYGTLSYGVNVGGGDADADAFAEIFSGAGPGSVFGPHVRGFDYDGATVSPIARVSFFAYPTTQYGVGVAIGDVDADGHGELLTGPGPGPGFSPVVRGFDYDGTVVAPIARIGFAAYAAGHGVLVAAGDIEGDGLAEIVTAPGPGPLLRSRFLGWNYDAVRISAIGGFDADLYATRYGGRAACSDVVADGRAELLTGAGRDPAAVSTSFALRHDGATLRKQSVAPTPFPAGYGVNVAAGAEGY